LVSVLWPLLPPEATQAETIDTPDPMRGQYVMIHNICATVVIYIGINKVGNARDRIYAIDNTRDRIGMHNVTRGNNRMTIDVTGRVDYYCKHY